MNMRICSWRALIAAVAAVLVAHGAGPADAQAPPEAARISDGAVKIGLILDMSGPYSDTTGKGSATAARMAVEDFGGKVLGAPIDVLIADGKDSSDHAAKIARDWFSDQHVDALMDVTGSSEALIVQAIANTRHKIVMLNSAVAARLSNEACTATSIHYSFDTQAIANTVGTALVERGYKTWFFITVDYSFGYDLEHNTEDVVEAIGGQVLGGALHPLGTTDFVSYLSRAQRSGAKVVALADGGSDLDGVIKTATRLGMIPGPQVLAGLPMRVNAVHTLGLATTQGMVLGEPFYWDQDDASRAWSQRFFARVGEMPNSLQAGVYSATTQYLKAVARAGTDETEPVLQALRETPINDFFAHDGHIRADGVMVHDMHLYQVKTPAESHGPWDYLKLIATVPAEKAFGSLDQSKCPLVKH
jgi:branched-chain amino acid transport system substrate-binding protein